MDKEFVEYLAKIRMPFGKYKGTFVTDLPEAYVIWFGQKGFPDGKLGRCIQTMYELHTNGYPPELRVVFRKIRGEQ